MVYIKIEFSSTETIQKLENWDLGGSFVPLSISSPIMMIPAVGLRFFIDELDDCILTSCGFECGNRQNVGFRNAGVSL